VLYSEPI